MGDFLLKSPIGMLLPSKLCMLPGLVYDACQLELVSIYIMLEKM